MRPWAKRLLFNTGKHPTTFNTIFTPSDKLPALDVVLHDMDDTSKRVNILLQAAQDRNSKYANSHRRKHTFKAGDDVLLSTKNLKFKVGTKKLHPKFIGPFPILKMVGVKGEEVAAKLLLPKSYRIHPVFHVSLLKSYSKGLTFSPLPPEPEIVDGFPVYEVECVLSHRDKKANRHGKTKREYLIKWLGYSDVHNSWEPEVNLGKETLDHYNKLLASPVKAPVQKQARRVRFNTDIHTH